MKSPSRRLGRGLGTFLDFGPADEDGAARIEGVLFSDDATSIIETSAEPVPRKHSPIVKPAARPAVAVVAQVAPTPSPAPAAAAPVVVPTPEPLFEDEFVVSDEVFGEDESAAAEEPAVAHAPVVAAVEPVVAAEPETVVDDSVFVDDVVGGLSFPDVELD